VRSMKRLRALFTGVVLTAAAIAFTVAMPGSAATPTVYSIDNPIKINVMGEWAHPDDDTSIIGPCGVWHQRYGVRCGIIMITRGEGGGNAVGTEIGPALGLRRENEDRVAHYRSGTVDIFNLDRVDFSFNQSAPETEFFWGHDETLGRITRIIRMTKPDIYIGFTPTLGAGHGNHQWAGRMIWEGINAAASASFFPDQLTGEHALETWQVKKAFSGGSTAGTGGTTTAADCTTGFVPAATNLDTVAGVPVAGRQRPGPARGHAEDLGAGRLGRRGRVPDAEPRDEQGHVGARLLALRADVRHGAVPAEHGT
jgi:LmbE family N-acetylglucosaminyl deacetylase